MDRSLFYPGAFTSGCTLEARVFQKDISLYQKRNAQIVGVSVDPVEKMLNFVPQNNWIFTCWVISVVNYPNPAGTIQYILTNVENRIPKHSQEVLKTLTTLQQP